jgi:N-acetylmuramoyl-L-alanine amidase
MNREIKYIVFHCTATEQTAKVENIIKYWKRKGWKRNGYHFIIEPSGNVTQLEPLETYANGVRGHNHHSIHISYIGGKDIDNRTPEQITSQKAILKTLLAFLPNAEIMGHRDFEGVRKSCPRFNAKELI